MSNAMKKPLTTKTIEMMKPKDFDKADIGEYSGLRVTCGKTGIKTFFYRYSSPITKKLTQVKIGSFPQTSLAEARMWGSDNICIERNKKIWREKMR